MTAVGSMTAAAALVTAHLSGADPGTLLDSCDTREVADLLSHALAGVVRLHGGGDPDALVNALLADRMRRALSGVS